MSPWNPATMSALPDVVVSAMPHAVSDEAMRCKASPTAPMRERAHHVDRPISRNASTRPYGILSSAPIRWANVPTKAEATPAAIVINDLTSAFWRYDHGRNSAVLFTVIRFSIGGDMTWRGIKH